MDIISRGLSIHYWPNELVFLFKLALTILLSTVAGIERANKRHDAGLRTFVLVALVCMVAGVIDNYLIEIAGKTVQPIITAAVLLGIAIISGNTILFSSRNQLKGLTTSMAMWATGAIGATIGYGLYTLALCSFVVELLVVSLFPRLEKRFKQKSSCFEVHLELKSKDGLQLFTTAARQFGLRITDIEMNPAYMSAGLSVYSVVVVAEDEVLKKKKHSEIIDALSALDCVAYIEEII